MNFLGLIYLIVMHYLTGNGVLRFFKLEAGFLAKTCLSLMLGVPLMSLSVCIMQLAHIPLSLNNIIIGTAVFALLFFIPGIIYDKPRKPQFGRISMPKLYEWPFLLIMLGLVVISIWRCFYMPPYSRDMLSGPELIAEYAVKEKTMNNSVFRIDLTSSNNIFKSPYITSLQIIYKLLVCPFGAMWLSVLFVSFTAWLFLLVRERQHAWIACILMLLYFAVPELFAYTFVILYDYSNMVFFFSGYWFLSRYLQEHRIRDFAFSVFLFGIATYIRTESLILISMITPMIFYNLYKQKVPIVKIGMQLAAFMVIPFLFYYVCINVFVRNIIPLPFDVSHDINSNLSDLSALTNRLRDILTVLIFSDAGETYYGLYFHIFLAVLVTDLIFFRKFNKEARIALYGVAVVYFGIGFVGYLLPLADLNNTTKRGLFKAIPLILMYLYNSGFISKISNSLRNWETPGFKTSIANSGTTPAVATSGKPKKKG